MKKQSPAKGRNLGVIVLAGTVCVFATAIIISLLPLTWGNAGLVVCASLIALIALAVAISGRVDSLKQLAEGLIRTFF